MEYIDALKLLQLCMRDRSWTKVKDELQQCVKILLLMNFSIYALNISIAAENCGAKTKF